MRCPGLLPAPAKQLHPWATPPPPPPGQRPYLFQMCRLHTPLLLAPLQRPGMAACLSCLAMAPPLQTRVALQPGTAQPVPPQPPALPTSQAPWRLTRSPQAPPREVPPWPTQPPPERRWG